MTDRKTALDAPAVALMLMCCVLWGLQQVIVKLTLLDMAPLLQGALRSAFAATALLLYASVRGIALFTPDGSARAGLAAGLLFGVEFVCIYAGLQYTGASRLIIFLYLSPFVVALGMPFIARSERLAPRQIVGMLIAFAALASAFAEGFSATDAKPLQWLGDSLAVAGAVLWGITTLVVRATRLSQISPEKTLFYQLAWSAPVLGLAAWMAGEAMPQTLSAGLAASMLYQAVVVAFASYLVWFWLIRHYPATRVAAFGFLTPLFGLLFGAWLLGEPVSARLLMALLGVAVGLVLVNRS